MKNAANAFSFFKQFGYVSLYIGGNGDLVEVFCHFSMYLKDKAFKNLKNQRFFLAISSNVSHVPRHRKRGRR